MNQDPNIKEARDNFDSLAETGLKLIGIGITCYALAWIGKKVIDSFQ